MQKVAGLSNYGKTILIAFFGSLDESTKNNCVESIAINIHYNTSR